MDSPSATANPGVYHPRFSVDDISITSSTTDEFFDANSFISYNPSFASSETSIVSYITEKTVKSRTSRYNALPRRKYAGIEDLRPSRGPVSLDVDSPSVLETELRDESDDATKTTESGPRLIPAFEPAATVDGIIQTVIARRPKAGAITGASRYAIYDPGPEPSPTRSQARAPRFYMHPLFSYTRLHRAPISYDIAFTPSARSVVDRTIHAPVPAVTLTQPATVPPIPASSQLVLHSPKLPWTVAVGPIGLPPSFFIGKSGGQRKATSLVLTNLDVLYAVHTTLMTRVTPVEWTALGEGSRAQRRVAEAYKQRCTRMSGGWEGGVRRVDWLGSKPYLVGVEIDKNTETGVNVGRLVFGKA